MDSSRLIVHSNSYTNYIDILPTDTLADARTRILQEFDADQLPSLPNQTTSNFAFIVDKVRISSFQETKNLCADIVHRGAKVELISIRSSNSSITAVESPAIPEPCASSTARQVASLRSGARSHGGSSSGSYACMDSSRSTVSDASANHLVRPLPKRPQQAQLQHNLDVSDSSITSRKRMKEGGNAGDRGVSAGDDGTSDSNNLEAQNENANGSGTCSQGESGAGTDTVKIKEEPQDEDQIYYTTMMGDEESETQKDDGTRGASKDGGHVIVQHDRQPANENSNNISAPKDSGDVLDQQEGQPTNKNPNKDDCESSDSGGDGFSALSDELGGTVQESNLDTSESGSEDISPATMPGDFTFMNGTERKVYWTNKKNLAEFFEKVLVNPAGAECEVCAETGVDKRCTRCDRFFHSVCVDESCHEVCLGCQTSNPPPQCHMCNMKGGLLLRAFAKPGSAKKWKGKSVEYEQSLFGRNNFCHIICGIFNPLNQMITAGDHLTVDCSALVMADGHSHILQNHCCTLCGLTKGAKVKCNDCTTMFHVTCARQAGLEVVDGEPVKCFHHVRCQFVLRARLEDLMNAEQGRQNDDSFQPDEPMDWNHAAALLNFSIDVLRTLGWAWRWASWWVEKGDNWEPFVAEGENENEMTDEELKRVKSTPDSRCLDARRCRLEALGAALRNRAYDYVDGDGRLSLERALTALLSIPSLVGPLSAEEIKFFTTWLGLAYWSKSPKLGFGNDQIPVAVEGGRLKHTLGNRSPPGKIKPSRGVFEPRALSDTWA